MKGTLRKVLGNPFDSSIWQYDGYDVDDSMQNRVVRQYEHEFNHETILNTNTCIDVAIDEQIHIIESLQSYNLLNFAKADSLLHGRDKPLWDWIRNNIGNGSITFLAKYVMYIALKIRLVFNEYQRNAPYSLPKLHDSLASIPHKRQQATDYIRGHGSLTLLRRVITYKQCYNSYLETFEFWRDHWMQIGLSKTERSSFALDLETSILRQFAELKSKNNFVCKHIKVGYESEEESDETMINDDAEEEKDDECDVDMIELENKYKHKTGKGGMYAVWSIMSQLFMICKNGIPFDKWRNIGAGIISILPPWVHSFFPPFMSGPTIRTYIASLRLWFDDNLNEKVIVGRWPLINAAIDAGSFRGYDQDKAIPVLMSTFYKKYGVAVRWMNITQTPNPTKERPADLFSILMRLTRRYERFKGFNAISCDNATSQVAHIELHRAVWPLTLMVVDWCHLLNKVTEHAINETWGLTKVSWRDGNSTLSASKSLVVQRLKETHKILGRNPAVKKYVQEHYSVGEHIGSRAGAESRFCGTFEATASYISKRDVGVHDLHDEEGLYCEDEIEKAKAPIIGADKIPVGSLFDAYDVDDDDDELIIYDDEDEKAVLADDDSAVHHQNHDDLHLVEQTLNLMAVLPSLSSSRNVNYNPAHFLRAKAPAQREDDCFDAAALIDAGIYDENIHHQHWQNKDLIFDPTKIPLCIAALQKYFESISDAPKTEKDAVLKLIEWWKQRPSHGAIMTVHALGSKLIKPLIDLNSRYKNRIIEMIPMIGEKFFDICKIRYALQWLLNKYDRSDFEEAVKYIQDHHEFDFRKQCARLHRPHRNADWCKSTEKSNPNQYACDKHLRSYDGNVGCLVHLLPPQYSTPNSNLFKKFYSGIFDPVQSNASDDDHRRILAKYLDDVFALTNSEHFADWGIVDGLSTLNAKLITYIQCYRCIQFIHYKYIERLTLNLEGGICIAPMLMHPDHSLLFAKNIIRIGRNALLERTCRHLIAKPLKLADHPEHYVLSELGKAYHAGYRGGVAYLHDDIWNLIEEYSRTSSYASLRHPQFELLWKWLQSNTESMLDTYPVECFLKPIKDIKGQQKTGENNLNNLFWLIENLQHCLVVSPMEWLRKSKEDGYVVQLPLIPNTIPSFCKLFPRITQSELIAVKRRLFSGEKMYYRTDWDPNIALGTDVDMMQVIADILGTRDDVSASNENISQHVPDMKRDDNDDDDDDDDGLQNGAVVGAIDGGNDALIADASERDCDSLFVLREQQQPPADLFEDIMLTYPKLTDHERQRLCITFGSERVAKSVYKHLLLGNATHKGHFLMTGLMDVAQSYDSFAITGFSMSVLQKQICDYLYVGQCHIAFSESQNHWFFIFRQNDDELSLIVTFMKNSRRHSLHDDEIKTLLARLGNSMGKYAVKCTAYHLCASNCTRFFSLLHSFAYLTAVLHQKDVLHTIFLENKFMKHTGFILCNRMIELYPSKFVRRSARTIPQTSFVINVCAECRLPLNDADDLDDDEENDDFKMHNGDDVICCAKCGVKLHRRCLDGPDMCQSCTSNGRKLVALSKTHSYSFMNIAFYCLMNIDELWQINEPASSQQIAIDPLDKLLCDTIHASKNKTKLKKLVRTILQIDELSVFKFATDAEDATMFLISLLKYLNRCRVQNAFGGNICESIHCCACRKIHTDHPDALISDFQHIVLPIRADRRIDENTVGLDALIPTFSECLEIEFRDSRERQFVDGQCDCNSFEESVPMIYTQTRISGHPKYFLFVLNCFETKDGNTVFQPNGFKDAHTNMLMDVDIWGRQYDLHVVLNYIPPHIYAVNPTGRYTAHLRLDDSWYFCEDAHIEKILDVKKIVTPNSYLFCFKRQ